MVVIIFIKEEIKVVLNHHIGINKNQKIRYSQVIITTITNKRILLHKHHIIIIHLDMYMIISNNQKTIKIKIEAIHLNKFNQLTNTQTSKERSICFKNKTRS